MRDSSSLPNPRPWGVSAAALLFQKLPPGIDSLGVVLSGGNVDFEDLAAY